MNENHKRALTAYLYSIEKDLEIVQRTLEHDSMKSDHIFYTITRDVRQSTKADLLHAVSRMLDEIRTIKEKYQLQTENESTRRRISTTLSDIWITINEMRPKPLEGYGQVTERDEEMLNSSVSRLLTILEEMYSSL